jgi:hypothetical protein
MPIKFSLYKNKLTTNPNNYSGRVIINRAVSYEEIIAKAASRGTAIGANDLLAAINIVTKVIGEELADGNSVNMPFANFISSIDGGFEGPGAAFDPARNAKKVNASPGLGLKDCLTNATVEKVISMPVEPILIQFTDATTKSNSQLTPGSMGTLEGKLLSFDEADAAQGIFFVKSDGTSTRAEVVALNDPAKLIFTIPTLDAGNYRVQVRIVRTNAEEVRIGQLGQVLSAA